MTSRVRRFLIVLAVAGAVLAFFQFRKERTPPHQPPAPAEERSTAQNSPAPLRPTAVPTPEPPPVDSSRAEDDDTGAAPSYQAALVERRARRLEARWKNGTPDPEWTRTARDSVTAQMQANRVRGKLTSVDCRTTLCRVDVQFARIEETMDLYKVQPAEGHQTYPVVTNEGGHVLVAVYVAPKEVQLTSITENQVR